MNYKFEPEEHKLFIYGETFDVKLIPEKYYLQVEYVFAQDLIIMTD